MPSKKKKIDIFKPYLNVAKPYKGGKATSEIKTKKRKIYKLSSNENPIGTSPKVLEAIKNAVENLHIYPDRTDARLRKGLAEFYNNEIDESQFIGACGGSEILSLIVQAFISEGHEVIISNPAFVVYRMFSSWLGSSVIDVPLKKPDYSLDLEGILKAVNKNTRLLYLTSPNNPTGTYIPKKDLEYLLDKLPDHVVVVFDEVYYHFAEAEDFITAMPYVKKGHNIIAINSFSKTFGLAAMRVGYAYTTKKIANYIRKICRPFLVDKLSIEAALAALEDKEFLDKIVTLVNKEKQYLYKAFDQHKIKYWPSESNFIMFKPKKMTSKKFEAYMQTEGVMVRVLDNFGAPGHVRLTIGTRAANKAFVSALKKLMA